MRNRARDAVEARRHPRNDRRRLNRCGRNLGPRSQKPSKEAGKVLGIGEWALVVVSAIVSDLRNHRSVFFCPAFYVGKTETEKYDNNLRQAVGLSAISGGGIMRDKRNSRLMETRLLE